METCNKQKEIAQLQSEVKTIFKRIDEQLALSQAVYDLVAEVRVMNVQMQNLGEAQDRLAKDLEELKATPKKRWDHIIQSAIGAIVGGVIAFALLQIGLK